MNKPTKETLKKSKPLKAQIFDAALITGSVTLIIVCILGLLVAFPVADSWSNGSVSSFFKAITGSTFLLVLAVGLVLIVTVFCGLKVLKSKDPKDQLLNLFATIILPLLLSAFALDKVQDDYLGIVIAVIAALLPITIISFIVAHKNISERFGLYDDELEGSVPKQIKEIREELKLTGKIFNEPNSLVRKTFLDLLKEVSKSYDLYRKTSEFDERQKQFLLTGLRTKIDSAFYFLGENRKRVLWFYHKPFVDDIWPELVSNIGSYVSVCDLSAFSRMDKTASNKTWKEGRWEDRVNKEISTLNDCKELERFDKVFLYSPRDEKEGMFACQKPPKGKKSKDDPRIGGCIANNCSNGDCMVQKVTFNWARFLTDSGGTELKESHIDAADSNFWLCSREDFNAFEDINTDGEFAEGVVVESNDVGIFGNSIFGEEFKVENEVSPDGRKPATVLQKITCSNEIVTLTKGRILEELSSYVRLTSNKKVS